jgi:hypothetical protein
MLQCVSVWLDERAPQQGAFAHALEWASRLRLPLRGITAAPAHPPRRVLPACAEACVRENIAWDSLAWQGPPARWVRECLSPADLCVVGPTAPEGLRAELLQRERPGNPSAALLCSANWSPLGRVLVLNPGCAAGGPFLASVVSICRAFQVTPVVLTVARSEREARARQEQAQAVFASQGLVGDFDLMVGCDVRTAVGLEARGRRCSHVFVAWPSASPWRRWLWGDPVRSLLGLSNTLSFVWVRGTEQQTAANGQRTTERVMLSCG